MYISLKEKARSRRKAALNAVRGPKLNPSAKIEVLRREFPVDRVCGPMFSSCRAAEAGGLLAA